MERNIITVDYNLPNKILRLWNWIGVLLGWNADLERKMNSLESSIQKLAEDVAILKKANP